MDPSLGFSLVAILVSALSYLFSRYSWFETYRPIVSARIETKASGNSGTVFNLIVCNTGNRPATNIRLFLEKDKLDKIISGDSSEILRNEIRRCFSDEGRVQLLDSGKSACNGFGKADAKGSTIKYGTTIPIRIEYYDLNRRKLKSRQILIYKDTSFFAGSGWE